MAEFGEQLKKAREAKGMTQQTLAEKIYVTRQTVSRWESGSRYPDLLTLKKLSAVLAVSADTLLGDEPLPVLVEKTPVIEKPLLNNLLVALYAAIVLVFLVQAYHVLQSFHPLDALLGGQLVAVCMAVCALLEAVLFLFAFVNILRGTDTPKKTGVVVTAFFLLELLQRAETVFNRSDVWTTVLALACFVPYLLGAYGGYLYFQSPKKDKGRGLLLFACAFEGFVLLVNLWTLLCHAPSFVALPLLLSCLLKLCICLTFAYEAHLLVKRRARANETTRTA